MCIRDRDYDVTEDTAENAQLSLAPEVVLRRVSITARKGDSLASLAARHGVAAASLADWNRLHASSGLKSGQHLVIFVPSLPPRNNIQLATRGKAQSSKKPARQVAQASRSRPSVR